MSTRSKPDLAFDLSSSQTVHVFGVTLEAIARLNRIFDNTLKAEVGISQVWFEALLRIERSGGYMTMGDLSGQIALTSSGVTRLVDRLVTEGFAERQLCPTDRRVQYVAITHAGQTKLAEAVAVHLVDLQREFADRMTPEETATLTAVMERLRAPLA